MSNQEVMLFWSLAQRDEIPIGEFEFRPSEQDAEVERDDVVNLQVNR